MLLVHPRVLLNGGIYLLQRDEQGRNMDERTQNGALFDKGVEDEACFSIRGQGETHFMAARGRGRHC
jgi:hypothetical protein